MKDFYDRRFVHFDWDDSLEGKDCILGDSIHDIKSYLDKCPDFTRIASENPNNKDHFPFIDEYGIVYRFCYYDPMLKFKVAKKKGRRIEFRFTNGGGEWKEMTDDVWTQVMEYRIAEEDSDMITLHQLSMWLAKGNGEYKYKSSGYPSTNHVYREDEADKKVSCDILVRRWGDDWHEPTMEYCFPKGTDE